MKYDSISIHALLAESDEITRAKHNASLNISIHALLAESDFADVVSVQYRGISIHALLAESDGTVVTAHTWQGDFYPRSPCGERH